MTKATTNQTITTLTTKQPILPDLLVPGLKVVFCGTAPGHISAARGHYYAHPQNKFWPILHKVGFTPERLAPAEFEKLLTYGIGLTDISKYDKGMDKDLQRDSLGKHSVADLLGRIEKYQPGFLAFTSMTGGMKFFGKRRPCGEQPERIGKTRIWVLPSTSPAAMNFWDEKTWHDLAKKTQKSTSSYAKD
jgi:double-stranded uracil-DNA glycosylase